MTITVGDDNSFKSLKPGENKVKSSLLIPD